MTEAQDLRQILAYLGIQPDSEQARAITGLTSKQIAILLRDSSPSPSVRRDHIRVVAMIIDALTEARTAASGSPIRSRSAADWLTQATL